MLVGALVVLEIHQCVSPLKSSSDHTKASSGTTFSRQAEVCVSEISPTSFPILRN